MTPPSGFKFVDAPHVIGPADDGKYMALFFVRDGRVLVTRSSDGSFGDCSGGNWRWIAPEGAQEPSQVAKPKPRRWGPWEEVATWEEANSGVVNNDADQRAVLVEVSESLWRAMGHKREWGLARFDHYVRYVGEGASMQQDAECEMPKPKPPEGYEFCSWKEAERGGYNVGRRGLYRDHSGKWRCDLWLNFPDVVAEGRLLWLRKVAKPEPRRWSSPDGSVVYEEVDRFEDADYAGVFGGEVLRTRMMGDESAWYIQTVMGGSFTDKWVRRVLGGDR
jgi:hypothetical protein